MVIGGSTSARNLFTKFKQKRWEETDVKTEIVFRSYLVSRRQLVIIYSRKKALPEKPIYIILSMFPLFSWEIPRIMFANGITSYPIIQCSCCSCCTVRSTPVPETHRKCISICPQQYWQLQKCYMNNHWLRFVGLPKIQRISVYKKMILKWEIKAKCVVDIIWIFPFCFQFYLIHFCLRVFFLQHNALWKSLFDLLTSNPFHKCYQYVYGM